MSRQKASRDADLREQKQAQESSVKPKPRAAPSQRRRAPEAAETDALDRLMNERLSDDPIVQKACKSIRLNAQAKLRTAAAAAASLILRLNTAITDYQRDVEALGEQKLSKAKMRDALTLLEVKRGMLGELRRTINAIGPLNKQLAVIGKLAHEADFDRMFRQIRIDGTEHFDDLCEGEDDVEAEVAAP